MSRALLLVLAAALALGACGGEAPAGKAAPAASPPLETLVVARESARRERVWDGVIEAVNQATLSAQTGGRVLELPFDVDDYVPAGAVVARFTDVEQQSAQRRAQAALAAAESTAREAEADYERIREIHARKLVAKAQLDQATARRDGARAALDSARAALRESAEQVDYTVIRAPYSGIVVKRHVQVGETVRPGQALISGISLGELRVEVQVPQSDVAAIREHRQAAVILDAASGERLEAKEVVVYPNADPQTHSFRVRLELPAQETGLHPGMTVKVAFTVGEAQRLLVPAAALLQRSEVTAVYVLDAQGPTLRQVRIGHRYGDRVEVLAGLDDGERIALDPVATGEWLAKSRRGAGGHG
ncbi:MAG: efflux RND transporter periplasmic adaptor subunit [Xanthomonadales bacterium]|nr:efflux RND transporter periplasmic adaptor subunit [Xanthomonadales bacterium]MBP6691023.1 efflux RND transporter periplasmic adaptor subunit [Xanthomonadales bacterium]MBP8176551.1 efflux RND transporter periplasmic adaptor subunit [Xanthomonadales bacterium]HQW63939.1 efflux RND transporter periplasmic adaptor subunit [Pseudomonadota bacterium]